MPGGTTPTNTIQIGGQQPNTGAACGGKIPFGVTNQSATNEKYIFLIIYKRNTLTPISASVVISIEQMDTAVGGETITAKDPAGQTANSTVRDETISIEVTARPMGSTLGDGTDGDALKGATLPPKLSYVKISNAAVINVGWVDGTETHGATDTTGDAYNSQNWQLQEASHSVLADGYWGLRLSLKRFKSPAQWNPAGS